MFERYNEKARRVIFFARYEAMDFDSPDIQSEHLLLGLLREGRSALFPVLGIQGREDKIRALIVASSKPQGKKKTSVELPLTDECKRILAYGAEEAMRLDNKHIGIEHLLLGILREEACLAARILGQQGLSLKKARTLIDTSKEALAATNTGAARQEMASNVGTSIRLVDAKTSSILLRLPGRSRIPHIGEAIRIQDAENAIQSYRIQDVVWELEPDQGNPGVSVLKEVKLLVAKEDSV